MGRQKRKMDKDIKKEALRQYIRYFRFWFIGILVLAVVLAGLFIAGLVIPKAPRKNQEAPQERVFDYADVLTDEEEQQLREQIAKAQRRHQIDIVLVTIKEDVEQNGYWETQMMNIADDFYDENAFGYDRVHGDGILLLDNWYEGQEGSWLSTCGRVYESFSTRDIDRVLDAVYEKVEENPFEGYKAYVDETCRLYGNKVGVSIPLGVILVVPLAAALIYALVHLRQEKAKDTTTATSFVEGGKPRMNDSRDEFVRKNVVTRRIQTSSSGGGRSGGGGGHRSSSGVRHGGGGRRR